MSSVSKRSWRGNVCVLWWRGQSILWSVVLAGVAINLVSSWLTTKQWDVSGTPFGWLLIHPIVLVVGSVLLILQTIGAFWIHRRGKSSDLSSASLRLRQREQAVLRACVDIEQAQPGPQLPSVATLLHVLQDHYTVQDVVDTLEYLKEQGEVELFQPFGGAEAWSFRLTPQGKRARALLTEFNRQKQIALDKVEKLVPGVDLSLYQDTFGKPTFINHKSFFMNPNDEMRKFVEYVFVDKYFYLDAIVDAEGKVLYFAVTIRDKSFNPTFKNQVFQVTLGISKYSDIPGRPRSAQGCYGANWFAYYETKYFGRSGAYEDFGFGLNSAGYSTMSSPSAYSGLLSTTHNCHGTLSDQEIESVNALSADEIFNTYAVSAPFIQITDYAHIILGVNYDQVRILNP